MDQKQPMFRASVDTMLIYKKLTSMEIGEFVSYDELSQIIGRSIQKHNTFLNSARKKALSHDMMVFDVVRGDGIKRVNDSEKIAIGSNSIKRSRRILNKGLRTIASIDNYDALTKEDQVKHNTAASIIGSLLVASNKKNIKAVEETVVKSTKRMLVHDVFKMFTAQSQ